MKPKPTAANRPVRRSPKSGRTQSKLRRSRDTRDSRGAATAPLKARDKRAAMRLPLYSEAEVEGTGAAAQGAHCTACGLCCSYVAIEVDAPSTVKSATQLLWYLYHDGVSLYVNDDEWMVQFEANCRHLQPDYRCGIYATRPHICREFSEQECEVNSGDDGHTFYTAGEFMLHLKQHRPRVHALVQRSFAPPDEPTRSTHSPFERRLGAVRARRATLGV
jgi:Fe-S-cluster containining protein